MLSIATSLAAKLEYVKGQTRHCSIIVDKRGRVISIGYNSYSKTHPKSKHYGELTGNPNKCFIHSELDAIRKDKHKKGYKIYVARVDSRNIPVYSKPCPACEALIKDSHLKSIEYTL